MNALLRLVTQTARAVFAILALTIGIVFAAVAWNQWASSEISNAAMAGFAAILFLAGAIKLRPRSSALRDQPTRKQLAFAAQLGINPKGMDKWELSLAIDEAIDERDLQRELKRR